MSDETDEATPDTPQAEGAEQPPLPAPNLTTHLFHLASQVSMALGEVPNPMTGEKDLDLRTARFLIDIIGMLDEKTAGNRTKEEDEYVVGVLANLRMTYVNKSK